MDKSKIEKITIFVDSIVSSDSSTGFLFKKSDKSYSDFPEKDFFIPIILESSKSVFEYSDVSRQQNIETIERQNFNPQFIEYGFFETISRNKIIDSSNLSIKQIKFIRDKRPDISLKFPSDDDLKNWFDNFGLNEMPWNEGASNEVKLDDLEKVSVNLQNIVSKASIYPIDINN